MLNRNGDTISAQISKMGPITFQPGQPFRLGQPFNLKNDGEAVILEVNLWGMAEKRMGNNPLRDRLEPGDNQKY